MQFGKHKYALGKRGQVQQVQVVQDKKLLNIKRHKKSPANMQLSVVRSYSRMYTR